MYSGGPRRAFTLIELIVDDRLSPGSWRSLPAIAMAAAHGEVTVCLSNVQGLSTQRSLDYHFRNKQRSTPANSTNVPWFSAPKRYDPWFQREQSGFWGNNETRLSTAPVGHHQSVADLSTRRQAARAQEP